MDTLMNKMLWPLEGDKTVNVYHGDAVDHARRKLWMVVVVIVATAGIALVL